MKARSIIVGLAEKRKLMLSEMSAKNSDTVKLNALSDSIGILHAQLKRITYSYYLDIKSICDEKQQQKLELLFQEMFVSDTPLGFPGKGGMNGNGRQAGKPFNNWLSIYFIFYENENKTFIYSIDIVSDDSIS